VGIVSNNLNINYVYPILTVHSLLTMHSNNLIFHFIVKNPRDFSVKNPRPAIDIRNRPRIPVPDEDPYSIAGSGSSGSSGNGNRERSRDKPPKLPPRDNSIYATGGLAKMKVN
jgi:hypothetical protein